MAHSGIVSSDDVGKHNTYSYNVPTSAPVGDLMREIEINQGIPLHKQLWKTSDYLHIRDLSTSVSSVGLHNLSMLHVYDYENSMIEIPVIVHYDGYEFDTRLPEDLREKATEKEEQVIVDVHSVYMIDYKNKSLANVVLSKIRGFIPDKASRIVILLGEDKEHAEPLIVSADAFENYVSPKDTLWIVRSNDLSVVQCARAKTKLAKLSPEKIEKMEKSKDPEKVEKIKNLQKNASEFSETVLELLLTSDSLKDRPFIMFMKDGAIDNTNDFISPKNMERIKSLTRRSQANSAISRAQSNAQISKAKASADTTKSSRGLHGGRVYGYGPGLYFGGPFLYGGLGYTAGLIQGEAIGASYNQPPPTYIINNPPPQTQPQQQPVVRSSAEHATMRKSQDYSAKSMPKLVKIKKSHRKQKDTLVEKSSCPHIDRDASIRKGVNVEDLVNNAKCPASPRGKITKVVDVEGIVRSASRMPTK